MNYICLLASRATAIFDFVAKISFIRIDSLRQATLTIAKYPSYVISKDTLIIEVLAERTELVAMKLNSYIATLQ